MIVEIEIDHENNIYIVSTMSYISYLQDTMGWGENDRGVSFTFGAEVRL